jgi:hypothetical protein
MCIFCIITVFATDTSSSHKKITGCESSIHYSDLNLEEQIWKQTGEERERESKNKREREKRERERGD